MVGTTAVVRTLGVIPRAVAGVFESWKTKNVPKSTSGRRHQTAAKETSGSTQRAGIARKHCQDTRKMKMKKNKKRQLITKGEHMRQNGEGYEMWRKRKQ